jgi:hypothetical protein
MIEPCFGRHGTAGDDDEKKTHGASTRRDMHCNRQQHEVWRDFWPLWHEKCSFALMKRPLPMVCVYSTRRAGTKCVCVAPDLPRLQQHHQQYQQQRGDDNFVGPTRPLRQVGHDDRWSPYNTSTAYHNSLVSCPIRWWVLVFRSTHMATPYTCRGPLLWWPP